MTTTASCDVCIVGAGLAGLNALFVAGRYLSRDQKVILIDRRECVGGMWVDTYPYVRLISHIPCSPPDTSSGLWDRIAPTWRQRERGSTPYEPYVSPSGAVLSIQPRSATLHLSSYIAYFLTHLLFLGKINDIPLYELDGQDLRAKCRAASPYTLISLVQYNLSLITDSVPAKVFQECGLDFDRSFPLPRRLVGMARFMLTHHREREHWRRTLDTVRERFDVRCGLLRQVSVPAAVDMSSCGRIAFSMTNSDGSSATTRGRHIVRLALFAAFLLGLFYLVAIARVIDVEDVRDGVAATGPGAPLIYMVVSAVLGAVFVPGPILAAGSGVLFGPILGTFVTLGAAIGTAIITSLIGRRAGRHSARVLLGTDRADRLDAQIERGGLWAVVGQRFVPGISDALASYAFGAFGVPLWQMAVGAFIGSAPRAFVYTALGASIGDLSAPLAYAAIAIWCVTAIVGAFAARRGYQRWRRASRRQGSR
jgi:uncharacterized membrane protein YdjX (TVP38/TMEM64 family)